MNICVIGIGYVGLVVGACLADSGNDVFCIDINTEKVENLKNGKIPIYEPGLEELVKRNVKEGRLQFSTDISNAIKNSLICFIAVGTPAGEDGSSDLKYVLNVAKNIGQYLNDYKIIVNKSTVPVGTAEMVQEIIQTELNIRNVLYEFDIVSNPEFLKEGVAIDDFMKPDRVIIGVNNEKTAKIMEELYSPFVQTGKPILVMDVKSAEMTKYAANAMLATKISFINEIANLCELVGADVTNVRKGIGSDSRIGLEFLFPGVGYGGSCFPKDIQAIIKTASEYDYNLNILTAVEKVNKYQKGLLVDKIIRHFQKTNTTMSLSNTNLKGKVIGIWGLSFKPGTDDMREAPSIDIINRLLGLGAKIKAYDPAAMEEASKIFGDTIEYVDDNYKAVKDVDALAIITEWNEFRKPNFEKIKNIMKTPLIFDGRNIYDPNEVKSKGFIYYGIGR